MASERLRLDQLLVELGHYATRSRARDAIVRGCAAVDGKQIKKPGFSVSKSSNVSIEDEALQWVSRAALKLSHALSETGFSPKDQICLDIGASTGGFTQVLLGEGAKHVFAIDVGHGQLDERIGDDGRVTSIEGLNARDLSFEHLNQTAPEFLVCDVSFISLRLALPPALELAARNAHGIFLVKPQFEVGKDQIGKGGIVKDAEFAKTTAQSMTDWLYEQAGWRTTHFLPSPVQGSDGNFEYLLAGIKDA